MTTKARASQILLTTIFAMILLSGIIIPASADADVTKINPNLPPNPNSIKSHIVSGDDVIFDNGAPSDEVINSLTCCVFADDFDFSEDQLLTDVHFWTQESGPWDNTLEYFIFEDDGGLPGSLITSGNGANIQKVDTGFAGFGGERFEYSFDLEDPVLLDGGIKFWFGLHLQDGFAAPFTIKWEGSCVFCGGNAAVSFVGTLDNWITASSEQELAFFLTGHQPVVGGVLLPIDATALMLAGLQSSAIWMIPTLAGLAAAGFYLIKFRTNKE